MKPHIAYVLYLPTIVAIALAASARAADDDLSTKNIKGWGKIIDPDGDCSIEEQDGKVTMTITGKHDLCSELPQSMQSPRILREVDGDFIAMVKLDGAFNPTAPSTQPLRRPYNGAGFLLWQDAKSYVRLNVASVERDGQMLDYLGYAQRTDGEVKVVYSQMRLKREAVWIRLERRGGKLYGAASHDNQQWVSYPPMKTDMPAKLQLGVMAASTSALPFLPEFSELEVYRRER